MADGEAKSCSWWYYCRGNGYGVLSTREICYFDSRSHFVLLCSREGLGKTVISLALILANPAPDSPLSGSPVPDLDALDQNSTKWDKGLYARTSSANPKIGRIISRGTLVVCKVSLVGQWIEEAKSKLKCPGLVYPYHGSNRKRDPVVLSENAIVVTTYETLSSCAAKCFRRIRAAASSGAVVAVDL